MSSLRVEKRLEAPQAGIVPGSAKVELRQKDYYKVCQRSNVLTGCLFMLVCLQFDS